MPATDAATQANSMKSLRTFEMPEQATPQRWGGAYAYLAEGLQYCAGLPQRKLLWSALAAAWPLAHVGQFGFLFLVETGILLTKVGFALKVFVLDVFLRFVLGMLFLLAGLSGCHQSYSIRMFCSAQRICPGQGSRRGCVNLRVDGTGSLPGRGRKSSVREGRAAGIPRAIGIMALVLIWP
jgi:hypothetical protein